MSSILTQIKFREKAEITHRETNIDILALSVRYKKIRDTLNSNIFIENLFDTELLNHITIQDFIDANTIRDYYSKKLMLLSLKGIELSPFRKDLSIMVNSNGTKFEEKMVPLIYKLPKFYEYDVELDNLFKTSIDITLGKNEYYFIKVLKKENKKEKKFQYWFIDQDKQFVLIEIETKNSMLQLWDNIIQQSKLTANNCIVLHGIKHGIKNHKVIDGYEYFLMTNVKLN